MSAPTIRNPLVFVPLGLGLGALAMVLVHAAVFGVVRQADEGTAARIFQLLLVVQAGVMAAFAARWLPRSPRATLRWLALQAAFGALAVATVVFLER